MPNNRENHPYRFYHPIRVRYVEVDSQQHVYFGHYLTYFDVALIEYMNTIGFDYQDMMASGIDMFYVASECQHKGRACFNDLLHIHARIGAIGNSSFTFEFAITKQPDNELVATGKITAVAVDIQTKKPVRAPNGLREAVARFEGNTGQE
ncbi:MAG: acyl-CoA thioesterase [Anaerolineae bacterium]|nr:acyl-CoA thioesterase [Anaerolineae bacterium]